MQLPVLPYLQNPLTILIQEHLNYTEYHKMKIVEINCETGEEIVRDATKAEKDDAKLIKEKFEAQEAEAEAKEAQRRAIADRLGLTAEELQVLLG